MNWKALKQFNQLFIEGKTSSELLENSLGKRIYEMEYVKIVSKKTIIKTMLYDSYYTDTLLTNYNLYNTFLSKYNISNTNFEESIIEALVRIENDREEIIDTNKTQKEISTLYFDNAKYLRRGSVIHDVILKILDIDSLAIDEYDLQYLWVLHCNNKMPKTIILCENKNQLCKPRLNDIELWYAGGRNTAKLKFIKEPEIPFYYLCDWDNKGIEIFQSIKKNFFPNIEILVPQEPIKLLDIKSEWKTKIEYSLFIDKARDLLLKLIPEMWIEEESINHTLLKRL